MKNSADWKETKFSYKNELLKPSKNRRFLHISSRVTAAQIANFYSEIIPKYVKGDLLDLGCGNVPLYAAYKDKAATITCIDWENSAHQNAFLDYTADLNKPLEFIENDKFDSIILSDVLEHIYKPKLLISEISRILKPGGVFIMNVPFYYSLHEEPFDFHRYTRHALTGMINDSGLKTIEIRILGGVPEVLVDIIGKQLSRIPGIGRYLCLVQNGIYFLLQKIPFIRKYSKNTGQKFPLAYGVIATK